MWLSVFFAVSRAISLLSGIAGWLHDRGQFQAGQINQAAKTQNNIIQAMRDAELAARIDSKKELQDKLGKGDF